MKMRMGKMAGARLAAAAGTLILAGLVYAAPGIAHPHEGEGDEAKVEKIIIIRDDGKGEHRGEGEHVRTFRMERGAEPRADGTGERIRTFRVERDGSGDGEGHVRAFRLDGDARSIDCGSGRTEIDESTGNEGERSRTRIVVCGDGDLSAAQRIEKLEKALGRINANEELSSEHKERVTAALRDAIERLRATP
jgi:hypothetical protein